MKRRNVRVSFNRITEILSAILMIFAVSTSAHAAEPESPNLNFRARERVKTDGVPSGFKVVERDVNWNANKTAVVICDMWDQHWCEGATRRVGDMAPRMNRVVNALRKKGALIIHAPSSTMGFYKDHIARKRAQAAPAVTTNIPLKGWCHLDKKREAGLPIDDSDGGCDCHPQCKSRKAWSRQIAAIDIHESDAITDDAHAYYLMRQCGIKNVILMGVHTNMCVLGRPFSLRQMIYQGQDVLLMRDMTDSMYNSRKAPFVPHHRGTELVVEHIEKFWAPTITSDQVLGGAPFAFKDDARKHLVILVGEKEYFTGESLPPFAHKWLQKDFRVTFVHADSKNGNHFPGIEAVKTADVLLVSVRRRTLPTKQLELVRAHIKAGKPIVGIRTSSHAFALRKGTPPPDHDAWPEFDAQVWGGNYTGHHGNKFLPNITVAPDAAKHPLLKDVTLPFRSGGSLYKNTPLGKETKALLIGTIDNQPAEPVAWTNTHKGKGRAFYTSLGHRGDFAQPAFQQLLANGIYWAAGLPAPTASLKKTSGASTPNQSRDIAAKHQPFHESWVPLRVPGRWDDRSAGRVLADYDGYAWYRAWVSVPKKWARRDLSLAMGNIDNCFEVYLNGERVGGAGSMPPKYRDDSNSKHRFVVPASKLRANKPNLIAVRIYDNDGNGGFEGAAPALFHGNERIEMDGDWQFRIGDDLAWAKSLPNQVARPVFSKVTTRQDATVSNEKTSWASGAKSPQAALNSLTPGKDLAIDLIAAEPTIAQPVFLNFDERGRMWVVEYRQYPHPAGLKIVSRDGVWRNVYDKVLPPPPHAKDSPFRGKDRISIHEDTNGDGKFDKVKTFLDGLNMATSVTRGRGGVWVMTPPYLMFYPDKNNDDIPDAKPTVHLKGFWLEDSHSTANSLRWGPDGWLYGAQGSTVSADIEIVGKDVNDDKAKPIHTQGQLIWRYHPEQRIFEVHAEGGGNAFGCEVDEKGRVFSGHNGGNTRGYHYPQGAYLRKNFGKHGALSNPYAFGHFQHIPHNNVKRFTHNFIVYEGNVLPQQYRGKIIGVDPINRYLPVADRNADGATFRTKDVSTAITTDDAWFRPVDIKHGPDGSIYIADWYDAQVNHYRNHEGKIDKQNGRIYRVRPTNYQPAKPFNLAKLSTPALLEQLKHTNRWYREQARRLIGDRKDPSAIKPLKEAVLKSDGQDALEYLWALNLSGGFDKDFAIQTLVHADPYVRAWTIRLLGDKRQVSKSMAQALAELAMREPHVEVRSQLASSAKRLPADAALPIIAALLQHDEDIDDRYMPLQVWWAIESKCSDDGTKVVNLFEDSTLWNRPFVTSHILWRLMRRFAASGKRRDLVQCARLLEYAPNEASKQRLMDGFEQAFKGRALTGLPDRLAKAIEQAGGASDILGMRQGDAKTIDKALKDIANSQSSVPRRITLVSVLGEVNVPRSVPVLIAVLDQKNEELKQAALTSLQAYNELQIGTEVINRYSKLDESTREVAQTLLASRVPWSKQLVDAVAAGRIDKAAFSSEFVARLRSHEDSTLIEGINKQWGVLRAPTPENLLKEMNQIKKVLAAGTGTALKGKVLFTQRCAVCHTLFEQGGKIGPDLSSYQRTDTDNMLLSIINPSAEIREGFENFKVTMKDDRVVMGFKADEDNAVVVIRGLDGQSISLKRSDIQSMKTTRSSIMPVGMLAGLTDQQLRDFFAYFRSTQPAK